MAFSATVALALTPWGVSSLMAADKKPEEFKAAIRAQDQGEWKASIDLMLLALQKQAEDGDRVRIYGTKYTSYLPRYYLGLAFYKQGNCPEALKEWDQCLNNGAVQETPEYQTLLEYRADCRKQSH